MPKKPAKLPIFKRVLLWLSKPLRLYVQYKFKVAIFKDIALEEARLRERKPHWNAKQIHKRARAKYFLELRKIGLAWAIKAKKKTHLLAVGMAPHPNSVRANVLLVAPCFTAALLAAGQKTNFVL